MEVKSENALSAHILKPAVLQQGYGRFDHANDEEIWNAFKSGSGEAFEFIYIKYFPVLFNYGRQFTRDSDLVKDIIQDLFIYLQEKKERLGDVASIKFYLYKSYRNRIVRHLNKNKFSWEELDYDRDMGFEIMLGDDFSGASALDEELKQRMEKAFAVLTKRQKEIIIYYFYEGFTYNQITALMGFAKVDYARILMSRTILKLRKELGDSMFALDLIVLGLLLKSGSMA
jgi:RNA polymerase sigma factor (sigma-70 family)